MIHSRVLKQHTAIYALIGPQPLYTLYHGFQFFPSIGQHADCDCGTLAPISHCFETHEKVSAAAVLGVKLQNHSIYTVNYLLPLFQGQMCIAAYAHSTPVDLDRVQKIL
jgi:hypothetical protein